MKEYSVIKIEQKDNEVWNRKPFFTVSNKITNNPLAVIYYWKKYKKYVFETMEGKIFANTCLRDVVDFLENEVE